MDLTDLECMLVVAGEQSITRAAARLYLSQPALSRRIRVIVAAEVALECARAVGVRGGGDRTQHGVGGWPRRGVPA